MERLQFKQDINAPTEKVYKTMLGLDDNQTYNQWTYEFNPTSTYEGSWDKGSKIYFIGTNEAGKREGMVSEIADNIENKYVSIRHNGMVNGEHEITEGPEIEKWAGSLENYTFTENNGVTTVTVEVDTNKEYKDYFNAAWPKALQKLKELAEK